MLRRLASTAGIASLTGVTGLAMYGIHLCLKHTFIDIDGKYRPLRQQLMLSPNFHWSMMAYQSMRREEKRLEDEQQKRMRAKEELVSTPELVRFRGGTDRPTKKQFQQDGVDK